MKNNDEIRAIVLSLIEELKAVEDGYSTTTWWLLKDTGHDMDQFDDGDLMQIHMDLFEEAEKAGLFLDMSAHDGMFEGLPYNLDYIVGKNNPAQEGLLVSIKTQSFGIVIQNEYYVFDRKTDNAAVIIDREYKSDVKEFTFTLSDYLFKRIKKLLNEPSLRREQESDGYVNESGVFVMDGVETTVDLHLEDGQRHFSYYNLDAYKDYLENYPQTKTVYEIISTIERAAWKEIRNRHQGK